MRKSAVYLMTATAVPQQKQATVCIWHFGIWLVVGVGAPKVTVSAGLREGSGRRGTGCFLLPRHAGRIEPEVV